MIKIDVDHRRSVCVLFILALHTHFAPDLSLECSPSRITMNPIEFVGIRALAGLAKPVRWWIEESLPEQETLGASAAGPPPGWERQTSSASGRNDSGA
jgi:hypothetical protein